ncbi:MAG: class IV adenylate cyclase, partial [Halonotius sp.]
AAGVLAGLGFEPAATVDKERAYYEIEGYTVVLDDVAELGTFVEIEQEAPEAEIGAVREGAVDILDRLGLDADEQIRTSYLGLLLDAETTEQE